MQLATPIRVGFRRPFTIVPDAPVDVSENGAYFVATVTAGDSTVTIDPESTPTSLKGWLNGDGSTGSKAVRFTADGRIGEEVQTVSLDVEYEVTSPDATTLENFTEGTDEPIPA